MIKTVGIVSLSSGIIGEEFIQFEVEIGLRRLREYGLKVKFMPNELIVRVTRTKQSNFCASCEFAHLE